MDKHYISNFSTRLSDLRKSLSRLQFISPNPKKSSQTLKGTALVVGALVLALSCYQWSSTLGANDFDYSHWPAKRAWVEALTSLNFKSTTVSENAKLLENHPDPYQRTFHVWLREDGNIVYVNRSPYSSQGSEFWIKTRAKVSPSRKLNWINLSSGISAFNSLISKLEEQKTLPKPKISSNLVDPKEIRY